MFECDTGKPRNSAAGCAPRAHRHAPAGAPPTMGGLTLLNLRHTQVSNAGCAALAAALDNGALPALTSLCLLGIPASAAAQAASVGGRGAAVPQLVLWN